jgi:hypothetical protein
VFAGENDTTSSEKIANLLAGVRAAREECEVLAFADSDGRVGRGWLRSLVEPLSEVGVGAVTGYRWHVPDTGGFWPLVRSGWDAVIAGRFGAQPCDFAWGGATAVRRAVFLRCRVPEYWEGAVSDDYRLSDAVDRGGLEIRFAPGALVAGSDGTTGREFLGWIRRQMILTRVHRPRLWGMALAAHVIYCAATVSCLVAAGQGRWIGAVVLAAIWALGMKKGAARAKLARRAMPGHEAWFRKHGWAHAWLVPLVTWLWMYSLAAAAFSRTIEWRGRRYRLARAR